MVRRQPQRQAIRRALILVSFLLLPVTLNYFSPYLIADGASAGVVNGSFIVFTLMFVAALFVGRLWCGWACPAAGLQEACTVVNGGPAPGGRFDWIKWAIWLPWVGTIAALAIAAGGYRTVNFFHLMDTFVSVDRPVGFIMYFTVVGLFLLLALAFGRRAGCHYICWMAPFMILGRAAANRLRLPALRLRAETARCSNCKKCTQNCPMSLDVNAMVQRGNLEHRECTLCGTCVDGCTRHVIRYALQP